MDFSMDFVPLQLNLLKKLVMENRNGLIVHLHTPDLADTAIIYEIKYRLVRAISAFLNASFDADMEYIGYYSTETKSLSLTPTNHLILKLNPRGYLNMKVWGKSEWNETLQYLLPYMHKEGIITNQIIWADDSNLHNEVRLSISNLEMSV